MTCEEKRNRCDDNICSVHSISCMTDEFANVVCECEDGYTSATCFERVDYCDTFPPPCGDGICISSNGYECLCAPDKTGDWCELDIDLCTSARCAIYGITRFNKGFSCFLRLFSIPSVIKSFYSRCRLSRIIFTTSAPFCVLNKTKDMWFPVKFDDIFESWITNIRNWDL